MTFPFSKYQGTGNDFILLDNRDSIFGFLSKEQIENLCNRKFGIGADGLMLLQNKAGYDFEMVYYNSDGNTSSMCGNGGRCIVEFARNLGIVSYKAHFLAVDGEHIAMVATNDLVSLKMNDVKVIENNSTAWVLNTGSPHYITFVEQLNTFDVKHQGSLIRYNNRFKQEGINVNFVEVKEGVVFARTYERGVEDETLSCGTGVTAVALIASLSNRIATNDYCTVSTLGGTLTVKFKKQPNNTFTDIWLEGPAKLVFSGLIEL